MGTTSVALESCLEEVKTELADFKLAKPRNNLLPAECEALKALKHNNKIDIKKADKGTTIAVLRARQKSRRPSTSRQHEPLPAF